MMTRCSYRMILGVLLLASTGGTTAWADDVLDMALEGDAVCSESRRGQWTGQWTLGNMRVRHDFGYRPQRRKGQPLRQGWKNSWLFGYGFAPFGMSGPTGSNWYAGGFVNVHVDDEKLHSWLMKVDVLQSGGHQATLRTVWDTPKAKVTLLWTQRSGDDKILLRGEIEPKQPFQKGFLSLLCYPHSFIAPYQRVAITTQRDLRPGTHRLSPDEHWVVYADRAYADRTATATPTGPCALLYNPTDFTRVEIVNENYGVQTHLHFDGKTRRFHLALWDFAEVGDIKSNVAYLRTHSAAFLADLKAKATGQWLRAQGTVKLPREREQLFAKRKDGTPTPFEQVTRTVVTPHVKWANPYAGGPTRVSVMAPVGTLREVVELSQRLDIHYTTHFTTKFTQLWEGRFDALYNMHYPRRSRTSQSILLGLYRELKQKPPAVLVLGNLSWGMFPEAVRKLIVERVQKGMGLVYVYSPQGQPKDAMLACLFAKRCPQDYVTAGVPISDLAVIGKSGPKGVADTFALGAGRVVRLNYTERPLWYQASLTPATQNCFEADALDYEYYQALLCRSVLWAAHKAPQCRITGITPSKAQRASWTNDGLTVHIDNQATANTMSLRLVLRNRAGDVIRAKSLRVAFTAGTSAHKLAAPRLPAGRWFADVWIVDGQKTVDWFTQAVEITSPVGPVTIRPDADRVVVGNPVTGTVHVAGTTPDRIRVELWNSYGERLVEQTLADMKAPRFSLNPPEMRGHLVTIRAFALKNGEAVAAARTVIPVTQTPPDDFVYLMWGDQSLGRLRTLKNRELVRHGVDTLDLAGPTKPEHHWQSVHRRAEENLWSVPYVTRYAPRRTETEVARPVRKPCLTDPGYRAREAKSLRAKATACARYGPIAYTLGDENYLGGMDFCFSKTCLADFRRWARKRFGTLDAANAAWGTDFATWDAVQPIALDEARKTKRLALWVAHRRHMDDVFDQIHRLGTDAIQAAQPDARVGCDGIFNTNAYTGYDFAAWGRYQGLGQVYLRETDQVESIWSFFPKKALKGAWFNDLGWNDQTACRWVPWYLLVNGFNSCWYWTSNSTGYGVLTPDLRANVWMGWMSEEAREIKRGLGKLLMHADRQDEGIAILYSLSSRYLSHALKYPAVSTERSFHRLIEDIGLNFRYVSPSQVQAGYLAKRKMRLLILPLSLCVSADQAGRIREFVEAGGTVLADARPGIADANACPKQGGHLDALFGIKRTKGATPQEGVVTMNAPFAGQLDMVCAEAIQPTTAKAFGAGPDGTPAVLVNQVGKGQAILLNAPMNRYIGKRPTNKWQAMATFMKALLAPSGITPPVRVTSANKPAGGFEAATWRNGSLAYVVLVKDRYIKAKNLPVQITFASTSHVYDMRAGRYVGRTSTCRTTISRGQARAYALLPYRVTGLKMGAPTRASAGTVVDVTLGIQAAARPGRHVVRLEVIDPTGKPVRQLTRNLVVDGARLVHRLCLALNAPAGKWTVRARDAATGQTAEAAIDVVPAREGR